MELRGVRQPAVREPEPLVEALGIDDERVTFPAADGAAEIQRVVGVALHLALLLARVGVNKTPVPIASSHHREDALPIALLEELEAEPVLEHARPALRQTVHEHRIVLEKVLLAIRVQIA